MKYESHLVASFCYRWGRLDEKIIQRIKRNRYTGEYRKHKETVLLSNPPNPIDKYIGDLFGRIDNIRFFLVEFKKERTDFPNELWKPARADLVAKLMANPVYDRLSWYGHFGCYIDADDILLEPYRKLLPPIPIPPNGVLSHAIDLPDFHSRLCESKNVLSYTIPPGGKYFISGLGLSFEGMKEYLRCVLAYFVNGAAGGPIATLADAEEFVQVVAIPPGGGFLWIPLASFLPINEQANLQATHNRREN